MQDRIKDETLELVSEFQFPSNGKVYCKTVTAWNFPISIPAFQFPSNGKVYCKTAPQKVKRLKWKQFQFPSNGKVYCKLLLECTNNIRLCIVSIPFKRESVLQERFTTPSACATTVSIPFKRESVLQVNTFIDGIRGVEFQFPSNGKVYCKRWVKRTCIVDSGLMVSIPFKRESVLQEMSLSRRRLCKMARKKWVYHRYRFNSLQTGKCIASNKKSTC